MATDPTQRDQFLQEILTLGLPPDQVAAMLGQFDREGNAPKSLPDAIRHEVEIITGKGQKSSNPVEIMR